MSFAEIERKVCPVCLAVFETNAILFHKRLKTIEDKDAITGFQNCDKCQARFDKGYVVMIEVDGVKDAGDTATQVDMVDKRTGRMVFIPKEQAKLLFDANIGEINFVDKQAFDKLKDMYDKQMAQHKNRENN